MLGLVAMMSAGAATAVQFDVGIEGIGQRHGWYLVPIVDSDGELRRALRQEWSDLNRVQSEMRNLRFVSGSRIFPTFVETRFRPR
jgi:hypothetical protein